MRLTVRSCTRVRSFRRARRVSIADQIHILDSIRLPFGVASLEFRMETIVGVPAGDQYQRIEFDPALTLVDLARQLATASIGAFGAVAEDVVHLQSPFID